MDLYRYTGADAYVPTDFERAVELIRQGRQTEAITLLEGVAEQYPRDAIPLAFLALAKLQLGNTDEASELLLHAARLNPDYMKAYYGLANIMEIQGEREAALAYYRKCLELFPESQQLREKIQELSGVTGG